MKKIAQIFRIKNSREILLAIIDAICVCVAFFLSIVLCRIDVLDAGIAIDTLIAMPLYAALIFVFSLIFGVYRAIWRYAGLKDYIRLALAAVSTAVVFIFIDMFALHRVYDLPSHIVAFFAVLSVLTFARMIYAYFYSKFSEKAHKSVVKRAMIIGAGYTAKAILEELVRKDSGYKPVCVIDDDVTKIGREIYGVPVVGNTNEIPSFAAKYDIATIIFAIPSMPESSRKNILANCLAANCELKILPYMSEIISNVGLVGQMKDVNIEDLLGRAPIRFDAGEIKAYIQGRTVMITGGGGSIGSELVRQIAKHEPEKIVVVDIYENCAYNIQQEIWRNYGKEFPLYIEIASVTDYDKMDELFVEYAPDIVYHAAAHKHVPLMETNPEEAVKNNVFGTLNVVKLAAKYKISKFIMISTDKAVNPTNIMGATKRLCEMIVQSAAQTSNSTEFAAVRFGNVLGSNGSVIPLFTEQIKNGGPVTVTHKDIIRYFMTIPEAVNLVLQAGAFAHGGEIFVLDMGSPVKIVTLAENLIRMLGHKPYVDIDIKFTGLRPGEKLYEELLMGEEGLNTTSNDKIFIGKQIEIDKEQLAKDLDKLYEIACTNVKADVVAQMKKMVPTYVTKTESEGKKIIKKVAKAMEESGKL